MSYLDYLLFVCLFTVQLSHLYGDVTVHIGEIESCRHCPQAFLSTPSMGQFKAPNVTKQPEARQQTHSQHFITNG